MESLMMKMYTHPEIVHTAFDRVRGFYSAADKRFFHRAGVRWLMDCFSAVILAPMRSVAFSQTIQ